MRLVATRVEQTGNWVSLIGSLQWENGGRDEVYYRFPAEHAPLLFNSADPFVPALLPASMMRGEPLEVVPRVDSRLLVGCERAAQILLAWNAAEFSFHPARFTAHPRPAGISPRRNGLTLSLFSGGVDSYFSLAKWSHTSQPVSHVLFVKGLEQPLEKTEDAEGSVELASEGAALFGAKVIRAETNLRSYFPELNYERSYQSAALASAALALSGGVRRLIVPSSFAYSQLIPWGSHPLLDGLWSSERLEIVHDGCEARRGDKLAALARHPEALARLRVCLENKSGPFNCGRCRKCARTMIALEILGLLPQAKLFPRRLPDNLEEHLAADQWPMVLELLDLARSHGTSPKLLRILERAVARRQRRQAVRALLDTSPTANRLWNAVKSLRPTWGRLPAVAPSTAAPVTPAKPPATVTARTMGPRPKGPRSRRPTRAKATG